MPLSTGAFLNNRYRIVRLVGQGGFGAVYRAWDATLSRPCAVKENREGDPAAQSQFEREARLLADLSHPNLARVIDYFFIPGQGQYFVMDYVEGENLDELLQKAGGVLPVDQTVAWIGQVLEALDYLHNHSTPVIHRDVKPSNIKINPQGRAILVDFGIAKLYDPVAKTTLGARAVTPGYSPPEQYGGGGTDRRSDLYALGATLYTLLTGMVPPESVDILSGLAQPPPPASQLNPQVSARLSFTIQKAMQIRAEDRFANAAQFQAALSGRGGSGTRPSQAVAAVTVETVQASDGAGQASAYTASPAAASSSSSGQPAAGTPPAGSAPGGGAPRNPAGAQMLGGSSRPKRPRSQATLIGGGALAALGALVILLWLLSNPPWRPEPADPPRAGLLATSITPTPGATQATITHSVTPSPTPTHTPTPSPTLDLTATALALGVSDADGDGLSLGDELKIGSDPANPDSDGDRLGDGDEVQLGSDPLNPDSDGDGLTDGDETQRGSNLLNPDSDGDSLGDGDEAKLGSDLLKPDSDGDGLSDGDETQRGSNLLDGDSDDDGLSDGDEVQLGGDLLDGDSDDDGLSDGDEAQLGGNLLNPDPDSDGLLDGDEIRLGSNPNNPDSDGDGQTDGQEAQAGSSLTSADSDGDGLSDGDELQLGSDPLDPDSDGDNLGDGQEAQGGTSPTNVDSDGDDIQDGSDAYPLFPVIRPGNAERLRVWQTLAGGTNANINCVAFSPDGRLLASGSGSGANLVRVWDLSSGRILYEFPGNQDDVISVAFSPDGRYLASASADQTVRIWYMSTGKRIGDPARYSSKPQDLSFSASGDRLAVGYLDGVIRIYNVLGNGALDYVRKFEASSSVYSVAYQPNSTLLAAGTQSGQVFVFDATGDVKAKLDAGASNIVWDVAYTPSGGRLAAGTMGGTVVLWQDHKAGSAETLSSEPMVYRLAFSPAGRVMASTTVIHGTLQVWRFETGASLFIQSRNGDLSAAFSPSGELLATGTLDDEIRIWVVK